MSTRLGHRETQEKVFQPIRFHFDVSAVQKYVFADIPDSELTSERVNTLVDTILPEAALYWTSTIMVKPVNGPLLIGANAEAVRKAGKFTNCPVLEQKDPPHFHSQQGVPNADLVIYVSLGGVECSSETETLLPRGTVCEMGDLDRPIAGTLTFCLENIQVNRFGKVPNEQIQAAVKTVAHEIGHILGMNIELFKFFRDSEGNPRTPRPFNITEEECVDGPSMEVYKPACNTLQKRKDVEGKIYYEVVTPTVLQVIRNHFDCQILTGARLENQPGSQSNCFGTNWEQRLHLMEAMASPGLATDFFLSPLTLALLEDSGWYKADYSSKYVQINPFGHGAGCDFVTKKCMLNGGSTVPSYSEGFFCNKHLKYNELGTLDGQYECDASHKSKAWCDLIDYNDSYFSQFHQPPSKSFQNFDNPAWGSFNYRTDYCPVALPTKSIDCTNSERIPLFRSPHEVFGEGSKCYNVVDEFRDPLCLQSKCNEESRVLEVYVGNITYFCERYKQTHVLSNGEGTFICPRMRSVCPQFYCPDNCAGRGVCDMSSDNPRCKCFDSRDNTTNCEMSTPNSFERCGPVETSSSSSVFRYFAFLASLTMGITMVLVY